MVEHFDTQSITVDQRKDTNKKLTNATPPLFENQISDLVIFDSRKLLPINFGQKLRLQCTKKKLYIFRLFFGT